MNQTERCKEWMKLATTYGARLFRNNTGRAWTGNKIQKNKDGSIIIHDPRPLISGLTKGSSDLIGWMSVEISADMIGQKVAVFVAVEDKSRTDRASREQSNFIEAVNKSGGRAGICRTEADLVKILGKTNQN